MAIDISGLTALCGKLSAIDLFGTTPKVRPAFKSASALEKAADAGASRIPLQYRQTYATAAVGQIGDLLQGISDLPPARRAGIVEQFYAPLYEHAKRPGILDTRPELRRFLAVVSNLYRSFVNANKRTSVNAPLVTAIPPLAFFQSTGDEGPYTVTSESVQRIFGTPVGIVSLPASYRDHPVLWSSLTHEVCGHDVVHADTGLIPELMTGVRSLFVNGFDPAAPLTPPMLNAMIWSYWIDEAVADVYGVLNMGPTFPLNLAAFFSAMTARAYIDHGRAAPAMPTLRTNAGPRDPNNGDFHMDEHPVDLLRLHLGIGVIDALPSLSAATRADYVAAIERVAVAAAHGATTIDLQGQVEISHSHWRMVNQSVPLAAAQQAARRVGTFLATAKLQSLRGHSIQDIETWDDADESAARGISAAIAANKSIVALGDDAQLLAGANVALLARPALYDKATTLLVAALDDSYDRDPIWGPVKPDLMIAPSFRSVGAA